MRIIKEYKFLWIIKNLCVRFTDYLWMWVEYNIQTRSSFVKRNTRTMRNAEEVKNVKWQKKRNENLFNGKRWILDSVKSCLLRQIINVKKVWMNVQWERFIRRINKTKSSPERVCQKVLWKILKKAQKRHQSSELKCSREEKRSIKSATEGSWMKSEGNAYTQTAAVAAAAYKYRFISSKTRTNT